MTAVTEGLLCGVNFAELARQWVEENPPVSLTNPLGQWKPKQVTKVVTHASQDAVEELSRQFDVFKRETVIQIQGLITRLLRLEPPPAFVEGVFPPPHWNQDTVRISTPKFRGDFSQAGPGY